MDKWISGRSYSESTKGYEIQWEISYLHDIARLVLM